MKPTRCRRLCLWAATPLPVLAPRARRATRDSLDRAPQLRFVSMRWRRALNRVSWQIERALQRRERHTVLCAYRQARVRHNRGLVPGRSGEQRPDRPERYREVPAQCVVPAILQPAVRRWVCPPHSAPQRRNRGDLRVLGGAPGPLSSTNPVPLPIGLCETPTAQAHATIAVRWAAGSTRRVLSKRPRSISFGPLEQMPPARGDATARP